MNKVFQIQAYKDGQNTSSGVTVKENNGEYDFYYSTETNGTMSMTVEDPETARKLAVKGITVLSGDGYLIDSLHVSVNQLSVPVKQTVEENTGTHPKHSFKEDTDISYPYGGV